jgi:hypothetical protein
MMTKTARVRVLNSLLYIKDASSQDLPEVTGEGAVSATPSCVAVSCLPDCDGETEIMIGPAQNVERAPRLIFSGTLETPSGTLMVETVLRQTILQVPVVERATHVVISTSGDDAADRVVVALG